MAKKIGLSIYSIGVVAGDKYVELHKIIDNKSFIDILYDYAMLHKKIPSNDPGREAIFYFDQIEKEEIFDNEQKKQFTILYGVVKTGEYGIESELMDIVDGTVYSRSTTQADLLPFGFCIAVAEGEISKGIILLQTTGNFSMKTMLQKKIQECFDNTDYGVLWGHIVPKAYIDRFFQKGELQKIRMIRYEIPEDVSNRIGINCGVSQTREERVIYKPVGFLERKKKEIYEWKQGQRSCTQIIELNDFEYDDLKFEFKMGKSNKVLSLKDTTDIRVKEDITDLVILHGGNPQFNSLKVIMRETAKEYLQEMGFLY